MTPVSYTHLDVYKRQAEAYTAEKEAAAQAEQERKQAEEDAKKAAKEAAASGSEPVSYTHLSLKCRTNGWISLQNVVQAKPIPMILWRIPWQMTPSGTMSMDLRPGRLAVKHFGHWRSSSIQHTRSAFIP